MPSSDFLGIGLYTVSDASRYCGLRSDRVRRWLKGYKGQSRSYAALWEPEIPEVEGKMGLSFHDLLEVLFVAKFLDAGLTLHKLRRGVSELSRLLEARHPFSTERIVTDGRSLLSQVQDEEGKPVFYDLLGSRNYALYDVILNEVKASVDYTPDGLARRWTPDPIDADQIVMDPHFYFGRPTVKGRRLLASVLVEAYEVEGSAQTVADWYEIDPAIVEQAVHFSQRFHA